MDYLAYGSNLDVEQMARRCPGATRVGVEELDGVVPWFGGPSKLRGGGVLSLRQGPGSVAVVRYRLTASDLETLDRLEGHPHFYVRRRRRDAWIYLLGDHVQPLAPTAAYLDLVRSAWHAIGADVAPLERAALVP